jgi:hypothetical protein
MPAHTRSGLIRPTLARLTGTHGAAGTRLATTAAIVACAMGLLALAGCATTRPASARPAMPVATDGEFCVAGQAAVNGSKIRAVNTVYTDYNAFVESKPAPRPLATRQYVWFEDAARTQPRMVSCKMKTADHIRVEYGADQVGEDTSCAAVNAMTLQAVLGSLTRAERGRLKFDAGRVVFDPDVVTTDGPTWLAPFPVLSVAPDGTLHVKSKGMKNDWLDPRLAKAEPRFKGTRYCHFVAPEYLRRVLLGDVMP